MGRMRPTTKAGRLGVVTPPRRGSADLTALMNTLSSQGDHDPIDLALLMDAKAESGVGAPPTPEYVAFAISEWDLPNRALFMVQMAPRSVFLPTMESYGELLRRAIERVQADARRDRAPPLEHVWCWTRGEHARLAAAPFRVESTASLLQVFQFQVFQF